MWERGTAVTEGGAQHRLTSGNALDDSIHMDINLTTKDCRSVIGVGLTGPCSMEVGRRRKATNHDEALELCMGSDGQAVTHSVQGENSRVGRRSDGQTSAHSCPNRVHMTSNE